MFWFAGARRAPTPTQAAGEKGQRPTAGKQRKAVAARAGQAGFPRCAEPERVWLTLRRRPHLSRPAARPIPYSKKFPRRLEACPMKAN